MTSKTTYSPSRGFTLIELLVVMTILSLLAALLLPALSKARTVSRRTACRAQLHGIGRVIRMYLNEHNDMMPVAAQVPSEEPHLPSITDALMPLLETRQVMHCPADNDKNYFDKEGTSYEYPFFLSGKRVDETFLGKRWGEINTPVLFDFEPFHNTPGEIGAMNFLFGDGHVGDLLERL